MFKKEYNIDEIYSSTLKIDERTFLNNYDYLPENSVFQRMRSSKIIKKIDKHYEDYFERYFKTFEK